MNQEQLQMLHHRVFLIKKTIDQLEIERRNALGHLAAITSPRIFLAIQNLLAREREAKENQLEARLHEVEEQQRQQARFQSKQAMKLQHTIEEQDAAQKADRMRSVVIFPPSEADLVIEQPHVVKR